MKNTLILIDNGHGKTTPGKQSPDDRLREWEWTRLFADRLTKTLTAHGHRARQLFSGPEDVALSRRIEAINGYGPEALLLSIHVNAAADGSRWTAARGFCAFVAPNASRRSRRLARLLTAEASSRGLCGNRAVPPDGFWTAPLAVCARTVCPAVLTENLFQDNREDVEYLLSEEGLAALTDVHVAAIEKYLSDEQEY